MSQLVRVQNFCVSIDGFGAGHGQSLEAPFGHAQRRGGGVARLPADLASWAFATASWPNRSEPGGSRGLDDYFTRYFARNIGAEIMGRNKFGPQRGPWDSLDWTGWWGDTPPFHTPVFVLTHHHRPSFTLADTTFHVPGRAAAATRYQLLETLRQYGEERLEVTADAAPALPRPDERPLDPSVRSLAAFFAAMRGDVDTGRAWFEAAAASAERSGKPDKCGPARSGWRPIPRGCWLPPVSCSDSHRLSTTRIGR
jgi:dihydrofolate reductase